jgi:hypothetical protein
MSQMEPPGESSKLLCALCVLCEKWIETGIGTVGNLELPHVGNALASRRPAQRKLLCVLRVLGENTAVRIGVCVPFASLAPFALIGSMDLVAALLPCIVCVKNLELPCRGSSGFSVEMRLARTPLTPTRPPTSTLPPSGRPPAKNRAPPDSPRFHADSSHRPAPGLYLSGGFDRTLTDFLGGWADLIHPRRKGVGVWGEGRLGLRFLDRGFPGWLSSGGGGAVRGFPR